MAGPSKGRETPPTSKRNVWLLGAAFVVVAALGIAIGLALSGGGSSKASTSGTAPAASGGSDASSGSASSSSSSSAGPKPGVAPPTTISTTGLDGPAAELATAINKAQGLTYHAVYKGTRTSSSGQAGAVTVEIWHEPPLARRDTLFGNDKGTVHTEELRMTDKVEGCIDTSLGSGEPLWTCVPETSRAVDPADPVLGVARPINGAVTARDDVVGTTPVRCFTVATPGKAAPEEACFDRDGIPAAFNGGDGRLERTDVGRGVDPAVIVPPAGAKDAPAGSGGSTPTTTT